MCAIKKAGFLSILFVVVLLGVAVIAEAQQPNKIPRIVYLAQRSTPTATTPDPAAHGPSSAKYTQTPAIPPPSPSSGLQRIGRWLTYNGQNNVYFVGTDFQGLVADPSSNIAFALDTLAQYRINKIRIWAYPWFAPPQNGYIHPWVYSGGKWNLDQWNETYFTRLQSLASEAAQRNMIVEVSIFSHYSDVFGNPSWQYPWNKANNTNGVFSIGASGEFSPEFYYIGQYGMPSQGELSASGHDLLYYQKSLVDKFVNTLMPYNNIYYEVANEFTGDLTNCIIDQVYPWQRYFVDRIKALNPNALVTAHSHDFVCGSTQPNLGAQYFWDYPSVDILNFHYYQDNPNTVSSNLHPMQLKNKVLRSNESTNVVQSTDLAIREAWAFFTGGGYYDPYWGGTFNSPAWITAFQKVKAFHDIVDTVPWWTMSPVDPLGNEYDSLVTQGPGASGWQVLANPGSSYAVYFWGTPSNASARINLVAGSYTYKWYDTRSAMVLATGSVSGGSVATISAPSSGSWDGSFGVVLTVLVVAPTPPPPSTTTLPSAPTGLTSTCIPTER
jgi:hypothetical protein